VNLADQSAEMKELTASIPGGLRQLLSQARRRQTLAVADGKQAVRYVRRHAAEWGVAKDRIGLMGFSAGAGLTMGVLLDHDADSRRGFRRACLWLHGRRRAAQGRSPVFIVARRPTIWFRQGGSVMIYQRWSAAHLPGSCTYSNRGPHGFGTRQTGLPVDQWQGLFEQWLRSRGFDWRAALTRMIDFD